MTPPVKKQFRKGGGCVAMKAPVGLSSSGVVCVSRWRGFAPPNSAGVSELQIKNTLSALYAQSATTTAASGGNREKLLGQRPARRACRPRHDADAGCRNPIAAGIQNRFICPPAAPPARLSGRADGSPPRQRSRPHAARTGRWRSPRPGGRADSAAPARWALRFPADGR